MTTGHSTPDAVAGVSRARGARPRPRGHRHEAPTYDVGVGDLPVPPTYDGGVGDGRGRAAPRGEAADTQGIPVTPVPVRRRADRERRRARGGGAHPAGARTTYLPGLDGVRALAVMAVLAYHFQAPLSVGGFLGVDIFFVLSGYLISSQLWSRWALRGPDLGQFWLGRLRRLFPAVLALSAVSLVAMLVWEREQLGLFLGDVGAAATYTSNWWYVLHERSYFEAAGRPPVLQHLWSLAVEEQFYLVWPLVVVGVLRLVPRQRGRRAVLVMISLALAAVSSLVMGIGTAVAQRPEMGDPSRWYFGTDSHAMGLLLGAALAFRRGGAGFGRLMPQLRNATRRATWIGVGCTVTLLGAIVLVDEFSVLLYRVGFPLIALVTVLLVSVVTRPGPVQRAYSLGPLRYLGQRSYGLYLWHWPVAAFTRPELDVPFDGLRLLLLRLTLSLALAELSFQLVEKPVRAHGWRRPWRDVEFGLPLVRLGLIQLVAGLTLTFAVPSHVPVPGALHSAVVSVPKPEAPPQHEPVPPDRVGPRRDLSVVVYGDSVAEGAAPAFRKFFRSSDNRAQVAEHSWVMLPAIARDARAGRVQADVVVINTGDNGLVPEDKLREALDALKDVPCVVLVTPKVPRSWEKRAADTIRSVAPDYRNVRLADWNTYADGHRAWFVADGIHLETPGQEAYVRLIVSAVSAILPPPPEPSRTGTPADPTSGRPTGSSPSSSPGSPARTTTGRPSVHGLQPGEDPGDAQPDDAGSPGPPEPAGAATPADSR